MTQKLDSIGLRDPKSSKAGTDLDYYSGKRILITGGTGFLGRNLIRLLSDVKCEVLCLRRKKGETLPSKGAMQLKEVIGDIRERATWERVLDGEEIIFHLAAQTSVPLAEKDPLADFDVNVRPLLYLAETCQERGWHPDLLFASTVTVTGIPTHLPVSETHPDRPMTLYDLHKWLAEQYLKHFFGQGIFRGAILRLVNVYGPGPASESPDRGVLNQMIRRALRGEVLTVYGGGEKLRDYLYVEDAMRAFLMAGTKIEHLNGRHFVIGSGQGHTISEAFQRVADQVASKTGRRVAVKHIEPPPSLPPVEARNFIADSRNFSERTGWRPRYSLMEGINQTIRAWQ